MNLKPGDLVRLKFMIFRWSSKSNIWLTGSFIVIRQISKTKVEVLTENKVTEIIAIKDLAYVV
tara:strand:+ start:352 stop:540 length:189 start_codon:yes stop_codon:yes gene_type:complete